MGCLSYLLQFCKACLIHFCIDFLHFASAFYSCVVVVSVSECCGVDVSFVDGHLDWINHTTLSVPGDEDDDDKDDDDNDDDGDSDGDDDDDESDQQPMIQRMFFCW